MARIGETAMRHRRRRVGTGKWAAIAAGSALLAGSFAISTIPDVTESGCSPRKRVVAGLSTLFGEVQRASAPAADNTVVEYFSSRANGTWTLLQTHPNGESCVVASGRADWTGEAEVLREAGLEI